MYSCLYSVICMVSQFSLVSSLVYRTQFKGCVVFRGLNTDRSLSNKKIKSRLSQRTKSLYTPELSNV